MYMNLLLVKNSLVDVWTDVFNRDQSMLEMLDTPEKAKQYVEDKYSSLLGNFSFLESETEIYTISELDISCINC